MKVNVTEVSVTMITGCMRSAWYNYHGYKKDRPHYLQILGIELHDAINKYINGVVVEVRRQNQKKFNNFIDWYNRNSIKVHGSICEKRLYSGHGFNGRIDMLTPTGELYDFKSMKYTTNDGYMRLQLAGYKILCEENGLNVNDTRVLFLGGEWRDVSIRPDEDMFFKRLRRIIDAVNSTTPPDKEVSHLCEFCQYAVVCGERHIEGKKEFCVQ